MSVKFMNLTFTNIDQTQRFHFLFDTVNLPINYSMLLNRCASIVEILLDNNGFSIVFCGSYFTHLVK